MNQRDIGAEPTLLDSALTPQAERDVETAEKLLRSGSDPKTVLRTLYCLARMDGLLTMAGAR